MNYITLEIRITRGQSLEPGKTYLVSASAIVPRGSISPAQAAFTISSDIEHRLHQILVDSNLRDTQALEESTTRAKEFGIELFNYLFQSEVQHLYNEIKARAVRQQSLIRLRLQIVPSELSTLPWELLHDNEQYLCLSGHPKILFARVPNTIVRNRALSYNPPLRLLGITASPRGHDELNIDKEKKYINTALEALINEKRVVIEWKEAEADVLGNLKWGEPWNVLHFIGHGRFDNKEGKLIFDDVKSRRFDFVDANRLRLALHKDIQLVFLNACDTARGDPLDYLSNFAYKLAVSGIPAIVAMQFKVTDEVAINFARFFYDRVAHGDAIDEAVTEARHHIYVGSNASSLEWVAPILYISTSSNILFKDVNTAPVMRKSDSFVDDLQQDLSQPVELIQSLGQATIPANDQQEHQTAVSGSPIISDKKKDFMPKVAPRLNILPIWLKIVVAMAILSLFLSISFYIFKVNSPLSTLPTRTLCLVTNLPENGTKATEGRGIQHGVELALKQSFPSTQTYHGYKLTESDMDDSSQKNGGQPDPAQGVKNLAHLSQVTSCPQPIAVIGPYSSLVAQSEIPVSAKNHILLLSPSNTAPCLTQQNYDIPTTCPYDQIHPQGFPNTYARLPGTDIDQGYLDADFLVTPPNPADPTKSGLGAQKIEIIGDEEIYGTQLAQAVIQELRTKGIKHIGIDCVKSTSDYNTNHFCLQLSPSTEAFSTDNTSALAAHIRDEHPDVVFFGGLNTQSASLLRRQLGDLGLDKVPFVGATSGFVAEANTLLGTIGSHAMNMYAVVTAADPSAFTSGTAAIFSRQYQAMFKAPPGPYSANGYDAANIVIQVIKDLIDAGTPVTKENVVQAIFNHNDFIGVLGNRIHFNSNGDNIGQRVYTIYQTQLVGNAWSWKVFTVKTD